MSGFAADASSAVVRPSPNFGARVGCDGPDIILLHYTGMESGAGAEDWLCQPESGVSSHYLVHEDGRVVQMVRESDRAWHAGRSCWEGTTDINSRSVGIEIVNPGHFFGYPDFPPEQISAVIALCRGITARHGVAPRRVLAHSDVAPGRKIDPGEKFPWRQLRQAGIGHLVEPAAPGDVASFEDGSHGEEVAGFQQALALYGYGIEISGILDERTRIVTEAFQRHFRPAKVDGVIDASTRETLRRLLAALGDDAA